MNITAETLAIFVYLIPGFISSVILNSVVVRTEKASMKMFIEALVFSFIIYAIISIFINQSPVVLCSTVIEQKTYYSTSYNSSVIIPVFCIAILIPIILGIFITHDWHMKFLRGIRVTNKTARDTVWLDVFTEQRKRKIIVNLSDGRRIFGWPLYYSNTPEEGKLYLYSPAYLLPDGKIQKLPIHGLFLVKEDYITSIEFLKLKEEKEKKQ